MYINIPGIMCAAAATVGLFYLYGVLGALLVPLHDSYIEHDVVLQYRCGLPDLFPWGRP